MIVEILLSLWNWANEHVDPAQPVALLAGIAVGVVIVVLRSTWMATRLLATYIHEAGHALMALLTFRRVLRIRLDADSGGSTLHEGGRGLGLILTTLAGYPAPAFAGWGICVALMHGWQRFAVLTLIAVVVLLALFQHSWRGWVVGLAVTFLSLVIIGLPDVAGAVVLAALAGYFFAASPRTIIELRRYRRSAKELNLTQHSDADALASLIGIPALVWEAVFLGAIVFALGKAIGLVLGL